MGSTWTKVGVLFVVALLAGCRSNKPNLKPPVMKEEFTLPPDDPKYSRHKEYPAETKNQTYAGHPDPMQMNGMGGMGGMSGMSGMGGMGVPGNVPGGRGY